MRVETSIKIRVKCTPTPSGLLVTGGHVSTPVRTDRDFTSTRPTSPPAPKREGVLRRSLHGLCYRVVSRDSSTSTSVSTVTTKNERRRSDLPP